MKITVEAAAKMTKLSVSSVRQISAKLKLGKREGGKKVFTMAEVKKLEGQKAASRKPGKTRKPAAAKRGSRVSKPLVQKAVKKPVQKKVEEVQAKTPAVEKRSFWGFLGVGRKQKTKVSIMDLQEKK